MQALETSQRLTITDEARDAIQQYFRDTIAKLTDTNTANYNFPDAEQFLTSEVAAFYPDSSFLTEQQELVATTKKQKLSELYTLFTSSLKDANLIQDNQEILDTIRDKIDPKHPLLEDPRPSNAYRLLAEEAFQQGDLETGPVTGSIRLAICTG